jgi:general secretion pathway protein C
MVSKRTSKKSISKILPKTAERIVAISLQHPQLGARRLVPLLKKQRISVSATTIQSVLRREGLQNRGKRLAKIKKLAQIQKRAKKARKPKSPPKKQTTPITDDVAERIVAISLKNPDFGARRLVPLLKKEGIFSSSSILYRILKRRGLQTRKKRLAKAKENITESVIIPKKFPEKIPREAEDRIVEISLQHPDYGARRLGPLLHQEEILISASAVYRILKRNNLENRQKRLLKLEELKAPKSTPAPEVEGIELLAAMAEMEPTLSFGEAPVPVFQPAVGAPIPPEDKMSARAEEPESIEEPAVAASAQPERLPVRKTSIKSIKKRSHWIFYPLYLLLFILIGYLGFHAAQTIQYAQLQPEALKVAEPAAVGMTVGTENTTSVQPLNGYSQIWERNLFNITKPKAPDSQKKVSLEKIALAKKDLGLELVGTVVADDPKLSRAIIDNRRIRKQEAYREGDTAGKARIKKILRNNVIITTAKGDELLTVEIKESGKSVYSTPSQDIGSQSSSAQQAAGTRQQRAGTSSIRLKRDEVADSLADIDGLMEQMKIAPYRSGDEEAGFRLGSITRDSVLRKMGLRSRDVIVGIDDETITSPDQASDFFKKLADGGEVTIKLKRRRRTRQIKLNIE